MKLLMLPLSFLVPGLVHAEYLRDLSANPYGPAGSPFSNHAEHQSLRSGLDQQCVRPGTDHRTHQTR